MKKILLTLTVLTTFAACKKDAGGDKEQENLSHHSSETWLLDPSTGWEHVMSLAQNSTGTFNVYDMTATEQSPGQTLNQKINVLYSELNHPNTTFYKTQFKENDADIPQGTKLGFSTSGKTIYDCQFIPNTFIPLFTNFEGILSVGVVDENNTRISQLITTRSTTSETLNYYYTKDGDFLASAVVNKTIPFSSEYWNWKYPTTSERMAVISTDKTRGGFESKIVIPLKLSDDKPYTFTIGTEGTQLRYQVLKLLPEKKMADPNYELIDQAQLTGLQASSLDPNAPSAYSSLVAYRYEDDVLTFVLADFKLVNGYTVMNKLHCYRWNNRTKGINVLWESPEVDAVLSNAITKETRNTSRYQENRLTPDGTFYTIFTKELYKEPQPDTQYAVLYTVNATGIKELNRTDYLYKNYKKTARISHCRYINGAYYALVYPIETEYIKNSNPKYHIEVVKLKP